MVLPSQNGRVTKINIHNETPPTHNNRSRGAGGVWIDSINTTIDFINDRV
jgi:hypothetical protein